MVNVRFKHAVVGTVLVFSVSAVAGAAALSRSQGRLRVERAVQVEPAPAEAPAEPSREVPNVAAPPSSPLSETESDSLERQVRNFSVRRAADGTISGQISLADPNTGAIRQLTDVEVSFVHGKDQIITAKPNSEGIFKAALEPGIYSLIAQGPSGYVAYGLQVVDPSRETKTVALVRPTVFQQEVRDTLNVDSLAIPITDIETVFKLAKGNIPASLQTPTRSPEMAETAPTPENAPEEPVPDDSSTAGTHLKHHSVRIQDDGSVIGRMGRLHASGAAASRAKRMNVFLVRDNAVASQAAVNEAGFFKFKNVAPGLYSFVSAGADGFCAFSVMAVSSQQVASNDVQNEIRFTAMQFGETFSLFSIPVPTEHLNYVLQRLEQFAAAYSPNAGLTAPTVANPAGLGGQSFGNAAGQGGGAAGGAEGFLNSLVGLGVGAGLAAVVAGAVDDANNGTDNSIALP